VLKTIAEALNGASDVDQALQTTLEQAATLIGLHAGWIWLTDEKSGRYYGAVPQEPPPFLQRTRADDGALPLVSERLPIG
jgi:hypothetical protein